MDNMFDKSPAEPSNGELTETSQEKSQGETKSTSQGEPQKPEPKFQEGTPQWFKSQLDKMSEKYEKQLTEKENTWATEKEQLTGQVQNILREFETIKSPPQKPEVLTPPEKPSGSLQDNPYDWIEYQNKVIEYNNKVFIQELKGVKEEFGKTKAEIEQEKELKKQQRIFEANKAKILGDLGQHGTPEEAQEIWENYISKNLFDPKSLIEYHRFKKTGKVASKTPEEKAKFPLPAGIGSNANVNENESSQFISEIGNNKFNGLFDKK